MNGDLVPGLRLAGDEFGVSGHRLAQHEEGRGHAQVGEDVENQRRPARVGAVIESDAGLGAFGRALEEDAGRVPARLIGSRRHARRGRQVGIGIADGARSDPAADGERRGARQTRAQDTATAGAIHGAGS